MGLFDGTELERPILCENCGCDIKLCHCVNETEATEPPEVDPASQVLRVAKARRKYGKVVTEVFGLAGSPKQMRQLLVELKNHCGAGGSLQDNKIEIQGDHVDRAQSKLQTMGYRVK